jgi:hypothetical protein
MLKHDDGSQWTVQFDHLPEMVRFLRDERQEWSLTVSREPGSGWSWDLGANYPKALELADTGWEEGVRNLSALVATVPNNTIVTRTYGVAGELPDVPRYLAGDPFNMIHRGRNKVPKPTMTIALNVRASSAVGAQEIANYGAAICALVDRLESRRVRVELLGLMGTDLGGCGPKRGRWAISWGIKRAQDVLDLSAVAFSYAHPAMFRRLCFAVMERSPKRMEDRGYGIDGGISPKDFIDLPEGSLLIKGVNHNPGACRTMPGALAMAKAQINEAYRALGHDDDLAELEDAA